MINIYYIINEEYINSKVLFKKSKHLHLNDKKMKKNIEIPFKIYKRI